MDTLLDMVQGILSSVDGDEVNSYSDTEESIQAANCIRDAYEFTVTHDDFPETEVLLQLGSSTDSTLPLLVHLPYEVDHIEWIRYNTAELENPEDCWEDMDFMTVDDFMRVYAKDNRDFNSIITGGVSRTEEMVLPEKFNSIGIHHCIDENPTSFCLLDNQTILFNSIDKEVDDILQNSKLMAYGTLFHEFKFEDDFTFPSLTRMTKQIIYNEAKVQLAIEARQLDNPVARSRMRKLQIGRTNRRNRIGNYEYGTNDSYPNFGRTGPRNGNVGYARRRTRRHQTRRY